MATRTKSKLRQKTASKSKEKMTAALEAKCSQLKALADENRNQTINFKYLLGKHFNEVAENPEAFGKDGCTILQHQLGIKSKKTVDTMRLFADTYTEQQIEAYNHRYDNVSWARTTITWSHWERLMARYCSVEQREDWMDQAVRNGWNATELARQMTASYDKGAKHGRKVKQPGSKAELLSKMAQPLTVYKSFCAKVWSDKDNPASVQLTHDLSDVDVDTVTQYDQYIELLQFVKEQAEHQLEELEKLKVKSLWETKLREEITQPEQSEEVEDADALIDSVL